MQSNYEELPITFSSLRKIRKKGILPYIECECGNKTFIPSVLCDKCGKDLNESARWKVLDRTGEILTYFIVYVAPPDLTDIAPYITASVDFGDGLKITLMVNMKFEPMQPPTDLIGKKVRIDFINKNSRLIPAVRPI